MFKKILNVIFFTGLQLLCLSQNSQLTDSTSSKHIDGLKQQLRFTKSDSARMMIVERIGYFYEHLNIDSSLHYFNEALNIAKQHSYAWAEARVLAGMQKHSNCCLSRLKLRKKVIAYMTLQGQTAELVVCILNCKTIQRQWLIF